MADTEPAKESTSQQPDTRAGSATLANESSQVMQGLLNQVAKVGFVCWLVAWALSCKHWLDCSVQLHSPFYQNVSNTNAVSRYKQVLLAQPASGSTAGGISLLAGPPDW